MSQNLGVLTNREMGCGIAQTLGQKGFSVSLFPEGIEFEDEEERQLFCNRYHSDLVSVMLDTEAFLLSLANPKRIFLAYDQEELSEDILKQLLPHLDVGDIVMDLCDTKYNRVLSRVQQVKETGASYLSVGILQGDRHISEGVSLLPGGGFSAYDSVRDILIALSTKMDGDFFCCPYIGPDGSGQYVKMVHDGLAASLLEIYAETANLVRAVLQCVPEDLAEILSEWNSGESGAYLLDVLCEVVRKHDCETEQAMIDVVLDRLPCGRGAIWMVENALSLSVPVPVITSAVDLCAFSGMQHERVASSKLLKHIPVVTVPNGDRKRFLAHVQHAMYMACLCATVQSFALLKSASDHYAWELNLLSIAKSFQGSSLVRSEMLFRVIEALERKSDLINLFTDPYFKSIADTYSPDLRDISNRVVSLGIPAPCLLSCVSYLDSYRTTALPTGMVALAWDYAIGSGFERNDRSGLYHGEWCHPDRRIGCKPMH